MKKAFLSLLFSAAFWLTAAPGLTASAEEVTDSFTVEVTEEISTYNSRAASVDTSVRPGTELNTDRLRVNPTAITIGDKTYIFAEFQSDDYNFCSPYFYDQDGGFKFKDNNTPKSSLRMDHSYLYYSYMDKFTGTKDVTVAVRTYVDGSYQWEAVDIATVTATEWNGSISTSKLLTTSSTYSYPVTVYVPGTVAENAVNLGLYDGDSQVGIFQVNSLNTSSSYSIPIASILGYETNASIAGNSTQITRINGQVTTSYRLVAGRAYTVKGTCNDEQISAGTLHADGASRINSAAASDAFEGGQPTIQVNYHGYTADQLAVRLLDPNGNTLADSEGGKLQYYSTTSTYYQLATSRSLAELKGSTIAVYNKQTGALLYDNASFNDSPGVADAYYNHMSNTVIARTYNLPDGITITARDTRNAEAAQYTSSATVSNNTAIFHFVNQNNVPTRLPVGSQTIYFSFELPQEESQSDIASIRVYGMERDDSYSTSSLDNCYYYTGKLSYPFVKRLSENYLNGSLGGFYAVLKNSDGRKISENISVTVTPELVNGVTVYKISGYLPTGLASDNYSLSIYRGDLETPVSNDSIYMLDPYKVYVRFTPVTDSQYGRGLCVSIPQALNYNMGMFSVALTDVMGSSVGIEQQIIQNSSASDHNKYFYFSHVPENLVYIRATALYNNQVIYDLDHINNTAVNYLDPSTSYSVALSTKVQADTRISLFTGFKPNRDTTAYLYRTGEMDPVKVWSVPANITTYLTDKMLSGLQYDNGAEAYKIIFAAKDGSVLTNGPSCYLGMRPVSIPADANGIYQAVNGNYYLYENGYINTDYTGLYFDNTYYRYILNGQVMLNYTGLAENEKGSWYVKNGTVDFGYSGLVLFEDYWWCVENGAVRFDYTGLWYDPVINWWYVENGTINHNCNDLILFNDKWWCIANGEVRFDYTGLWYGSSLGWWYVENGVANFNYNGLAPYEDKWWCVTNGEVRFDYTGPWNDPVKGWWYVENGAVNFNRNGLIFYDNKWWCVAGGAFRFDYTGLWNDPALGWWYVENGVVNFNRQGLDYYNGDWWCVAGGAVRFDYTGMWSDPAKGWWYVQNGAVNLDYNGLIQYNNKWWCVANGAADFDYTGLWSDPKVGQWYVENGTVNFNRRGLIPDHDKWWYIEGGAVRSDYTGIWNDPAHGRWYVENGAVNFDYNGLIRSNETVWCVAGGAVRSDYTGLWNDPELGWWYVVNGVVDTNYSGLIQRNDSWWCVENGAVNFDYTGLWNDPSMGWWYVNHGEVDFGYTGPAEYDGNTYRVEGGKVIF